MSALSQLSSFFFFFFFKVRVWVAVRYYIGRRMVGRRRVDVGVSLCYFWMDWFGMPRVTFLFGVNFLGDRRCWSTVIVGRMMTDLIRRIVMCFGVVYTVVSV